MKKSISILSNIDNVALIENFIDSLCVDIDISEDDYGNIFVAIIEAVTNAIKHGNKNDATKYVFVDAVYDNGVLEIDIKDEGLGFDYNNLPDPTLPDNILKFSGRGIYLIRSLSDKLEFYEGGTLLKIFFNLH
jgi:serine/threonine-protein kinase RsbW